jgi:hypothetical protein
MAHRSQIHQSYFSYNLTRPYPFRWFTPVAICLLVIATILFSVVNIASSGYTLVVLSTHDPNTTLDQNTWLKHWPSFVTSKIRPTCQPFTIPVQTQVFTNNTALTYTLTDIWQDNPDGSRNASSSLLYQNNLIENCSVQTIDMVFESEGRSAIQLSFSEWGLTVSLYATCSIMNTSHGPTRFNLTMAFDYVPDTAQYGAQNQTNDYLDRAFLSRKTMQASLFWGKSLLSMTWAVACRRLQDIGRTNTSEMVTKGTLNYRPRLGVTAGITDLSFFELDYQFIKIRPGSGNEFVLPPHGSPADIGGLDAEEAFPNIWTIADTLAKAAYSTVLTDLGQTGAPHNLLVHSDQVQHFTANFSYWNDHTANARPGPLLEDYATLKDSTGPLGVNPSVFVMDYICQVPRQKAWANLIISVLIADLVFLQATWKLYKLAIDYFFATKIPNGQMCEGCGKSSDAIPLMEGHSEDLSRRTTV